MVTTELAGLLALEPIEKDRYRAPAASDQPGHLFGGLVAAQALAAAGSTVAAERAPHSLHGYFLRGGDAACPTVLRVERDHDGRSFSSRRVVAFQGGEAIFSMSASFQRPREGTESQPEPSPSAAHPDDLEPLALRQTVSTSLVARLPDQPFGDSSLPTRFWFKSAEKLADEPLVHACVLTYLSDISSGLGPLLPGPWPGGTSLDHAIWFHRPVRLDEWVLMDLVPHSASGGRGWYNGTMHSLDGVLAASLAQEAIFRRGLGKAGQRPVRLPVVPAPRLPQGRSAVAATPRLR
jgi:acyl-CoA thioesterase II